MYGASGPGKLSVRSAKKFAICDLPHFSGPTSRIFSLRCAAILPAPAFSSRTSPWLAGQVVAKANTPPPQNKNEVGCRNPNQFAQRAHRHKPRTTTSAPHRQRQASRTGGHADTKHTTTTTTTSLPTDAERPFQRRLLYCMVARSRRTSSVVEAHNNFNLLKMIVLTDHKS